MHKLSIDIYLQGKKVRSVSWSTLLFWQYAKCSFRSNIILDIQQHFLKWTSLEACTCLWWSRCLDHNTLGSHSAARYFDQSCWSRELCLFAFDVQRGQFSCPKACSVVFTFCLLVDLQAHRFLTHKNEWEFHSDLQADITG